MLNIVSGSLINIKSKSLNPESKTRCVHTPIHLDDMLLRIFRNSYPDSKIKYSTEEKINTTSTLNIVHSNFLMLLLNISKFDDEFQKKNDSPAGHIIFRRVSGIAKSTVTVADSESTFLMIRKVIFPSKGSKKPIKKFPSGGQ